MVPRPIKTPAQRSRREALFAQANFVSFAGAMGVSPEELVALWPFGSDGYADQGFAVLSEQSAPAAIIDALCARLMQEGTLDVSFLLTLRPRFNARQRDGFARRVLAAKGGNFATALRLVGPGADMEGLIETGSGKALVAASAGDADIMSEVQALALLASQNAARAALEQLIKAGLMASDPRLDLLRLNANLNDSGVTA